MNYVVSVGGGISSTLLLPLELLWGMKLNRENLDFIMCKLPNEDPDVWKLVDRVQNLLNIEIKMIGLNKTPFDIFFEAKFLGNSRIDPCSRMLKREQSALYVKNNYDPETATIVVGIGQYEIDREIAIKKRWKELGYLVLSPLTNYSSLNRQKQIELCKYFVGFVPRLYLMGFSHNNCGGACIKAGKKEWARLWYFLPEVYDVWERDEERFRSLYGDYTILREMIEGVKYQVTLREFRERLEKAIQRGSNLKEEKMLDQFQEIERSDYFQALDPTPACSFCDAMA